MSGGRARQRRWGCACRGASLVPALGIGAAVATLPPGRPVFVFPGSVALAVGFAGALGVVLYRLPRGEGGGRGSNRLPAVGVSAHGAPAGRSRAQKAAVPIALPPARPSARVAAEEVELAARARRCSRPARPSVVFAVFAIPAVVRVGRAGCAWGA